MPFPQQNAGPFNKQTVESLAPNQMGCYGLWKAGAWVYIGKGDIRQRLLAHLNGDNPCIVRERPTYFYTVVTRDYDAEEKRLILEFRPLCNEKVG